MTRTPSATTAISQAILRGNAGAEDDPVLPVAVARTPATVRQGSVAMTTATIDATGHLLAAITIAEETATTEGAMSLVTETDLGAVTAMIAIA